ncbi:hypothetical protein, partial [Rhizobium sp. BK049]|uniref:hypothetical protein n=1 Tax=Rhizobium sp. BK049 TaxID=2587095 RepID=UPI001AEEF95B
SIYRKRAANVVHCAPGSRATVFFQPRTAYPNDAARSLYGPDAKTAAAWCALGARSDGRSGDFSFWVRVFKHLST